MGFSRVLKPPSELTGPAVRQGIAARDAQRRMDQRLLTGVLASKARTGASANTVPAMVMPTAVPWTASSGKGKIRSVTWVVWSAVGLVVASLLALSWWLDRDARKRGATPLSGRAMGRARWERRQGTRRDVNALSGLGMLPKSQDAARDIWRGKSI